jgi:hypothetical protein
LVFFLQSTYDWFREQFSASQGGFRNNELSTCGFLRARTGGLLEGFSELIIDFKEASPKKQPNIVKTISPHTKSRVDLIFMNLKKYPFLVTIPLSHPTTTTVGLS